MLSDEHTGDEDIEFSTSLDITHNGSNSAAYLDSSKLRKTMDNNRESSLAEVDLLSFADDGKQPDYLDLPLAKDERGSTM